MLKVEDIHFSYGEKGILRGVTFSAQEGEIIALIGTSGSGKTTLFRLITGLLAPLTGTILIGGRLLPEGAMLATYMRQEDLLLPWRTVMGNLLLFSELGKQKRRDAHFLTEASLLLKRVGLESCGKLYPRELSGGMRQRVALARALLQNRPLMLLDEPFASLDVIMREQLYVLLREIRDQFKKTIVMVTHDFRDALALADRILVLAQGKIAGSYVKTRFNQTERLMQQIRSDLTTLKVS
jgi:NitT/TauT family transport system ATP-binding protein